MEHQTIVQSLLKVDVLVEGYQVISSEYLGAVCALRAKLLFNNFLFIISLILGQVIHASFHSKHVISVYFHLRNKFSLLLGKIPGGFLMITQLFFD